MSPRQPAPHVAAALGRAVQPSRPERASSGSRAVAPHVAAALGRSAQPKAPAAGAAPARPVAPHVVAAVGAAAQPKPARPAPPAGRPEARHVVDARGRTSGRVVNRSAEYVDEILELEEPTLLAGHDSGAIYRVMPEWEWEETQRTGLPVPTGAYFWSPTLEYVQGYMKGGGSKSSSNVLVKIPLATTYLEFLRAVGAATGGLHANNFGKKEKWLAHFPEVRKLTGKKNSALIMVKDDNGTLTLCFKGMSSEIGKYLGTPERID